MPRLENWSPVLFNMSINFSGKEISNLTGIIFDDDRRECKSFEASFIKFNDGTSIVTSQVLMLDTVNMKAQTANTLYDLGKPCPAFIESLRRRNAKLSEYDFDKR